MIPLKNPGSIAYDDLIAPIHAWQCASTVKERHYIYATSIHHTFQRLCAFHYKRTTKYGVITANHIIGTATANMFMALDNYDFTKQPNPWYYFNRIAFREVWRLCNIESAQVKGKNGKCNNVSVDVLLATQRIEVLYDQRLGGYARRHFTAEEPDNPLSDDFINDPFNPWHADASESSRVHDLCMQSDPDLVKALSDLGDECFNKRGLTKAALKHLKSVVPNYTQRRAALRRAYK